nr:hypothetical protein [Nonomuraea deserti]
MLVRKGGQLGDRLQGAGLVVGGYHRHQDRILIQPGGQRGRVHQPVAIDRQHRHPGAVQALQRLTGFQDGRVLGDLSDHVRAGAASGQDRAAQGEQIGLRTGGGEDDLARTGADQGGNLLARVPQCRTGPLTIAVAAGRVAEQATQVRRHLLGHARVDRGGGVVVEVDRPVDQPRMRQGMRGRVGGHAGAPASTGSSDNRHSSMPSLSRIARRPESFSSRTAS